MGVPLVFVTLGEAPPPIDKGGGLVIRGQHDSALEPLSPANVGSACRWLRLSPGRKRVATSRWSIFHSGRAAANTFSGRPQEDVLVV